MEKVRWRKKRRKKERRRMVSVEGDKYKREEENKEGERMRQRDERMKMKRKKRRRIIRKEENEDKTTRREKERAKGLPEERIVLTSAVEPKASLTLPQLRLVDGPSILAGRLQIFHNSQWRSVCTNSRNWTRADLETACRQLGFQGGQWWGWVDRQPGFKPRLLFEEPKCTGTEASLFECDWTSRQLGSGVCDYHPDLGIQCLPQHVSSSDIVQHWRGVRFEEATTERKLTQQNTLYVHSSLSELAFVDIRFGGSGRDYNATSAVQVDGVPPRMTGVHVLFSAYNGINITMPEAPVTLKQCTLKWNRGYGLYINSSSDLTYLNGAIIQENGADGVKFVHHDALEAVQPDRTKTVDFCTFPTTTSQIFPIAITVEQNKYSPAPQECSKYFYTQPGHVLTLHFVWMWTDRNDSALIEVYDGASSSERQLALVSVRNGTRPQSVVTTRNTVYIKFKAEARTQMVAYMKLTAGYQKSYDLNITDSTISDNNGRGIAIENMHSQLHVHQTAVSNNNHVAGIHVSRGVGDVNITQSRISFNTGDGVNISYTGGNTNITRSCVSSNKGFGIAVWMNDSLYSEHVAFNQTAVVSYTEIFRNDDIGVFVGNFCRNSYVNVTGNSFNNSLEGAVEVLSCCKPNSGVLRLQIGHNEFIEGKKLGIKLKPALNIEGLIEYNYFSKHTFGCILVKNQPIEEFDILPTKLLIENNQFELNQGVYVVNIGLSPYSEVQSLLFTRNFVRDNHIREPFEVNEARASKLMPRSRVAAPVVVSSSNVDVFRNIIQNLESTYEVGSHLEDQSLVINCTYNWLGSSSEERIYSRLFHRKDRYNLAKLVYLPFLLHSSNPSTTLIMTNPTFVPQFNPSGTNVVGGEVDGVENLRKGDYVVERDINVRPGGRLTLQPGVTLRFPPSVGVMVAGKLEARGRGPDDIRFTLKEEIVEVPENNTEAVSPPESQIPVRLIGGRRSEEGRLQVRIDGKWGTVCNYGWTMIDAAVVCHQLGLVLNPDDWFLERSETPQAGISERIVLSNVRCTDDDTDITKCPAERENEFENSCTHEHDVGVRCHMSSWAGVRLGVLAERADLQFITIERAGLLDYSTNQFKPALQVDFSRHALENVKIKNNLQDGLGVVYSDLYSAGVANTVKQSDFSGNGGSGISFKQLGLKISGSSLENNKVAGIHHNPTLTAYQQREIAGWFKFPEDQNIQYSSYKPILIPQYYTDIDLEVGDTKYFLTQRVGPDAIDRNFNIRCKPGYVVGIQLLNPVHNRSTEDIVIYDARTINSSSQSWSLRRDLVVFPTISSSYGVVMQYRSGSNALGGAVLAISTVPAPIQDIKNRIVGGPVPTLTVTNSRIKENRQGIRASFYNRYLNEIGDHFLRKSNESIQLFGCDISYNYEEAVFVHSPFWDVHHSNISEITIMINNSIITDNRRGIHQFSRDLRSSNNLFHWILRDNTIERNNRGGFDVSLPYVWQYNENFTHSLYIKNNTWRNNKQFAFVVDGHFAQMNLTHNVFEDNQCKSGLISVRGMEKRLKIAHNRIVRNSGLYMVEFRADSQSEIMGEVDAKFYQNEVKENRHNAAIGRGFHQVSNTPSCVIGFHGIQKVNVNRNLLGNNGLDYELIAGIRTAKLNTGINVLENWWGSSNVSDIKKRIFDFDDWNNHAIAKFRPYLTEDSFDSSVSVSWDEPVIVDLDNLGGRLKDSLTLYARETPYIIRSDITVMPGVTLTIRPGVVMEFAPNVGILVIGVLKAQGRRGEEIIMRPASSHADLEGKKIVRRRHVLPISTGSESIRLCTGRNCTVETDHDREIGPLPNNEGFLEYYNQTTMQWVPLCDDRFTERNAQVVCRELGFDSLNVYMDHGTRVEYHPNSLTRIWSWPEPLQCIGDEARLEDCPIRLNGQLYGHRHRCEWNSKFVFIHCGERNLPAGKDYWGGIRFAAGEFEQNLYEHRIHDVVTHQTTRRAESVIEHVNVTGAGILHNEKSPAVQSISRSPAISNMNITHCASDGINLISPLDNTQLLFNSIESSLGIGISAVSLTGEGRESSESSFTPLREVHIPYHIFSMIDMCDTTKMITLEERVLIYYRYDNNPVNCVKIFNSVYHTKPFGFRLLQFNLFNSTNKPGKPDSITLYDGDIYNTTSKVIASIEFGGRNERRLFRTRGPSLSVKLFATGASNVHGFIAEIVTLPISAIGFISMWTPQQKAFCVLSLAEHRSIIRVQRLFRRQYNLRPREAVPTYVSIMKWDRQLRETGSLLSNAGKHSKRKVSDENVERIREAFQRSPRKSIRQASVQLNIPPTTVHTVLHKRLRLRAYKLQLHQMITPNDKLERKRFAETMLDKVDDDDTFLTRVCFSDEATFHVSGKVNRHNCRIWGSENPITANTYLDMLQLYAVPQLPDGAIFQQDGAPPHFANMVRTFLDEQFPARWIGRGSPYITWPARSPDLTPPDFFLWGFVKDQVYRTPVRDLADLQERIYAAVNNVTPQMLHNTWVEVEYRLDISRATNGSHVEVYGT
ncbi:hypothetical protein ANN_09004 [Periplaneta americana]|uniref:SRCR domain-containing protein n=1 Tax=Periplaneta americana TaxID=6978 RepID=A0ABQ8TM73_PERAM|nr:hypothetical protein ANN_09004 [Periplaneta americana]